MQSPVACSDCICGSNAIAYAGAIGSDPRSNAIAFIHSDDFVDANCFELR